MRVCVRECVYVGVRLSVIDCHFFIFVSCMAGFVCVYCCVVVYWLAYMWVCVVVCACVCGCGWLFMCACVCV